MKPELIVGSIGVLCLIAGAAWYGSFRTWHPIAPKPRKGKTHIVCIGDSITFGAGVVPFQKWHSIPAYLQKQLGKKYQVMNFGLSGRTLLRAGDMPYTQEPHFPKTLQIENAHYLIMLGTNDTKPFNWNEDRFRTEWINNAIKAIINCNCLVISTGRPCGYCSQQGFSRILT